MTPNIRENMFDLSGKTALVTGGGKGLGRALVHGLAGHGARVISVARSADGLAETFSTLGPEHRYIVGDLTTDELYEELDSIPEDIDILVNNHGGDPFTKPWPEQTPDDWRGTYEINVVASMRLIHLLSPKMAKRGFGRIINVASVYGILGQEWRERSQQGHQPPEKVEEPRSKKVALDAAECGANGKLGGRAWEVKGGRRNDFHPGGNALG